MKPNAVPPMSEADLQAGVIDLAEALGYLVMHLPDSRGQKAEGFPDLFLLPTRPPGSPLFIELKAEGGKLTVGRMVPTRDGRGRWAIGQTEWRDALLAAGQRWYLWKPADWEDRTIERVLNGEADARNRAAALATNQTRRDWTAIAVVLAAAVALALLGDWGVTK